MRNNSQQNGQPSTPNLFSLRQRLNSMNSPFISPLRIVHSPILNNTQNIFDFHLRNQNFQLEPQNPIQDEEEQEQIQQPDSQPVRQEQEDIPNIVIEESNILQVILRYVNLKDDSLNRLYQKLSQYGDPFIIQLFDYLVKKFKKLRKTKEEMIKYSIRKAFRYITDQLKKQMPNYAVDSNQYLQYYFYKYQKDQSITVPFKKDSLQKTMNSAFLKKIFTCDKFISDYKIFLKTFKKQYIRDNQKKIDSMKEIIKKCLDNFKRLPWTSEILQRLDQFSRGLLEYAPKNGEKEKIEQSEEGRQQAILDDYGQRWADRMKKQQTEALKEENVKFKTKSVILLTPPMHPMNINSPHLPDLC